MSYWEAAPDPLLLPFVERVSFSTDEGELPLAEGRRVVPDGCVDLLFEVADVEASAGERPCRAELLGTKTRALMLTGTGSSQNVALTLLGPGPLSDASKTRA